MRFCFRVVSPGKTYCLQAESEADRARWMEAITAAVAGLLSNATAIERSVSSIASPPRSRGSSRGHSRAGSFSAAFGFGKSHRRTASAASDGDHDTSFEQVSPGFLEKRRVRGLCRSAGTRAASPGRSARDGGRSGRRKRRDSDSFSGARGGDGIKKNGADPLAVLARVRAPPGNAACADARCGARMGEPEPRRDALHARGGAHDRWARTSPRCARAFWTCAPGNTARSCASSRFGEHERQRAVRRGSGKGGRRGEHRRRNRGERAFRSERETVPNSPLAEKTAFVKRSGRTGGGSAVARVSREQMMPTRRWRPRRRAATSPARWRRSRAAPTSKP